jgi:N-acetylmuramoyl-L-alanine amidase
MLFRSYDKWSEVEYKDALFSSNEPFSIIVHHTYVPRASAVGDQVVRNIQNFHMSINKWDNIAYHYVIDADGVVYECRKEHHNGSHTYGANKTSIGVCCIGNYDLGYDTLTPDMSKTLVGLLDDIRSRYKIPRTSVFGHREFADKSCPGHLIYKLITEYRGN